jgi:hypothetical protein
MAVLVCRRPAVTVTSRCRAWRLHVCTARTKWTADGLALSSPGLQRFAGAGSQPAGPFRSRGVYLGPEPLCLSPELGVRRPMIKQADVPHSSLVDTRASLVGSWPKACNNTNTSIRESPPRTSPGPAHRSVPPFAVPHLSISSPTHALSHRRRQADLRPPQP